MTPCEVETAYAKINLALHVRGELPDGYHAIETLFVFADDGDRLGGSPADALSLRILGPFADALAGADDGDNLVLRAAQAMAARFAPGCGAALTLDKRLPVASGIGGGSADAAAAIRLLDRLWDLRRPLAEYESLAVKLGADVPACLYSRNAIGVGKGEALSFVDVPPLAGKFMLLANPGVAVSTADIFRRWDGRDRGPLPDVDLVALFQSARNDLEAPAIMLVPVIGTLLEAMREHSDFVRMSGSGATCFALFSSRQAAMTSSAVLSKRFTGLWTMAGRVRGSPCTVASGTPQTAA